MTELVQSRLESSDLLSLVGTALGKSIVEIPEWQSQPLGGGAGKAAGGRLALIESPALPAIRMGAIPGRSC